MIDRIKNLLVSPWGKVFLAIAAISLAYGAYEARHVTPIPPPSPTAPVEARFVELGRAQGPRIPLSWAVAYEAGADALRSGSPVAESVEAIRSTAAANVSATFDRYVAPDLAAIVPPGKPEPEITGLDRARLEAAFRGYARGLRGKRR